MLRAEGWLRATFTLWGVGGPACLGGAGACFFVPETKRSRHDFTDKLTTCILKG